MEASSESKTLDHRLSVEFYAVCRRAHEGAGEHTVHAIAGERLSLAKLKLLHILGRPHERPPRISRIGDLLGVTDSSATKIVTQLEQARLVDRIADEDDERVKRVVITPRGREAIERVDQAHVGNALRFFRELSGPERKALERALGLLTKRPDVARFLPSD